MANETDKEQRNSGTSLSRRHFIESGAALATLPAALIASMGASPARAARPRALIIVQQPGSLRTVDPAAPPKWMPPLSAGHSTICC